MLIGKKEGNVLFNDALNTFYLWLYGVRHMVKDHSDSERGNPLPPHGLLFSIDSKGSFICTIPDRITHTMAFVTQVVEHWLEREIAQSILVEYLVTYITIQVEYLVTYITILVEYLVTYITILVEHQ